MTVTNHVLANQGGSSTARTPVHDRRWLGDGVLTAATSAAASCPEFVADMERPHQGRENYMAMREEALAFK